MSSVGQIYICSSELFLHLRLQYLTAYLASSFGWLINILAFWCLKPDPWLPHNPASPAAVSYSHGDSSVLPVGWTNDTGVSFDFSFFLTTLSLIQSSNKSCWFSLQRKFRIQPLLFPSVAPSGLSHHLPSIAWTRAITSSWVSLDPLSFSLMYSHTPDRMILLKTHQFLPLFCSESYNDFPFHSVKSKVFQWPATAFFILHSTPLRLSSSVSLFRFIPPTNHVCSFPVLNLPGTTPASGPLLQLVFSAGKALTLVTYLTHPLISLRSWFMSHAFHEVSTDRPTSCWDLSSIPTPHPWGFLVFLNQLCCFFILTYYIHLKCLLCLLFIILSPHLLQLECKLLPCSEL